MDGYNSGMMKLPEPVQKVVDELAELPPSDRARRYALRSI